MFERLIDDEGREKNQLKKVSKENIPENIFNETPSFKVNSYE